MCQTQCHQVVLFNPGELGDDPHDGHLGHEMLLLVFCMEHFHQRVDEVELGEALVDGEAD